MFLSILPYNGNEIIHSIDKLDLRLRNIFFDSIGSALNAVKDTADQNNEQLNELFAYQHIAENEIDYDIPFAPYFPHIHWHTFGIPANLEPHHKTDLPLTRKRSLATAYWDPTISIAHDLMKTQYPDLTLDVRTSSLILRSTDMTFAFSPNDRSELSDIVSYWRSKWLEVASCFTDFSDSGGRYTLFNAAIRKDNIRKLFQKHPEFSENSINILNWLSDNVQQTDTRKRDQFNWSLLAKGIHGSLGYRYDMTSQQRTLRFSPRAFGTAEKSAATGGEYLLVRNGFNNLDQESLHSIFAVQHSILSKIK